MYPIRYPFGKVITTISGEYKDMATVAEIEKTVRHTIVDTILDKASDGDYREITDTSELLTALLRDIMNVSVKI